MEVKVIAIEQMMPERQHPDDAGADLKADRPCRIAPGTTRMVFTGTFVTIDEGERIAQMVIVPIATPELVRVDDFDAPTERGEGGFGSTGKWGELYDEMEAEGKR